MLGSSPASSSSSSPVPLRAVRSLSLVALQTCGPVRHKRLRERDLIVTVEIDRLWGSSRKEAISSCRLLFTITYRGAKPLTKERTRKNSKQKGEIKFSLTSASREPESIATLTLVLSINDDPRQVSIDHADIQTLQIFSLCISTSTSLFFLVHASNGRGSLVLVSHDWATSTRDP